MKQCSRCKNFKEYDQFACNKRRRDGHQDACKTCQREYVRQHYNNNKEYYIDKASRNREKLLQDNYQCLIQYYRQHPCADCGETDPGVLVFDHLRDKEFDVSRMLVNRKLIDILPEL